MANDDLYFVYDGQCPPCLLGATKFRIRQAAGELHLLDKRVTEDDHPLIQEINAQRLDLDAGMVIKYGGRLYQGEDALHLMALIGSNQGWFNRMNAMLFKSKKMVRFCYPAMRAARNTAIRLKGTPKIRNLEHARKYPPIFAPIFGEQWLQLPPVMHKHYANRPYSKDVVTVEGIMKVESSAFARLLSPLFRLAGALVPYEGDDIPVIVHFRSEPDSNAYCFDRIFCFPGRPPCHFRSRMVPVGGDEVVEFMRIGIGWRARYTWDGSRVVMQHRGYVMKRFGRLVPLPLELLMGSGNAWEEPIDDNRFRMYMDIRHPLFGTIYSYGGEFRITGASGSRHATSGIEKAVPAQ